MSQFDEMLANIDGLHKEAEYFSSKPSPRRARRMLLLSECISAALQAFLLRFETTVEANISSDSSDAASPNWEDTGNVLRHV